MKAGRPVRTSEPEALPVHVRLTVRERAQWESRALALRTSISEACRLAMAEPIPGVWPTEES